MIPGTIMEFLNEEATVAVAGTRDRNLVPHVHRVSGWSADPDGQAISCLIADAYTGELVSSLEDNGQFAVTIEQLGPHKTYQFKGDYVDSRPVTDADLIVFDLARARFAAAVHRFFGLPADLAAAYFLLPSLVVRFTVREIFLQTPGPGAGQRLVPPEEQ